MKECLERWRFTQYESHILFRLLNRWNVLCPKQNPLDKTAICKKGKDLILALENAMDNILIDLSKKE